MKENKGITLVALIITIIVMLILVGVTISAVVNSDIIGQGEEAARAYENKQTEEQSLNFETEEGKTIANYLNPSNDDEEDDDEDEEVPDLLKKYVLGEQLSGRDASEIMNFGETTTFKSDESTISDAETTVKYKFQYNNGGLEPDGVAVCYDIEYNSIFYRIEIVCNIKTGAINTTGIYKIYEENTDSKVGKLVSWDSDGKNGAETWIILYDDDEHGLQIISANAMEYKYTNESSQEVSTYLFLGLSDTYLKSKNLLSGSTYIEKAIYSYNSAISTLNSACNSIITERTHVSSVRSVGSNPINKDSENEDLYSNSYLVSNPVSYPGSFNNTAKDSDSNLKFDIDRLVAIDQLATKNNLEYWLASRRIQHTTTSQESFSFCVCSYKTSLRSKEICGVRGSSSGTASESACLRPVVTLDPSVIFSGSGTSQDPYTF